MKTKKMFSKVLAAALAVLMLVGLMPVFASAAESDGTSTGLENLVLDKTATLEDDGTYTIKLEAYAKGNVEKQTIKQVIPTDVVLILDQSGSMEDNDLMIDGIPSNTYTSAGDVTNSQLANSSNYYYKVGNNYYRATATKEIVSKTITWAYADGTPYAGAVEDLETSWTASNGNVYNTANPYDPDTLKTYTRKTTTTAWVINTPKYVNDDDSNDTVRGGTDMKTLRSNFMNKGTDGYTAVTYNDIPEGTGTGWQDQDPYYVAALYKEVTRQEISTCRYVYTYTDADGNTVKIGESAEAAEGELNASVAKVKDASSNLELYTRDTTTGYRMAALKYAAERFINDIYTSAVANSVDHRIAIVGFGSSGSYKSDSSGTQSNWGTNNSYYYQNSELFIGETQYNYAENGNNSTYNTDGNLADDHYAEAFQSVSTDDGYSNLIASINKLEAAGGTHPSVGFEMANGIFNANANLDADGNKVRNRIVIFLTDGDPGDYSQYGFDSTEATAAINAATLTKAADGINATVYTVAVLESAPTTDGDTDSFLKNTSSSGSYTLALDGAALDNFFQTVDKDISSTTTTVKLTENSYVIDRLSDYFAVPSDFSVEGNVSVQVAKHVGYEAFATPTAAPAGVTASVSYNTEGTEIRGVSVQGFNFVSEGTDGNLVWDNSTDTSAGSLQAFGNKLIVTISGLLAKDKAAVGTYIDTNSVSSGVWDVDGDGNYGLVKEFPMPTTLLDKKTFVLDYAKGAELDIYGATQFDSAEDLLFSKVPNDAVYVNYGTVTSDGTTVVYTPNTMKWDGYDTFYALGKDATKGDESTKNIWSKVNVLPANNVYYEDTFITNTAANIVGITYDGNWSEVETGDNAEDANGGVHGWVEDLADDTGDSDGTNHSSTKLGATATFTFTGTGFDVYSRTNMYSGMVYAKITWKEINSEGVEVTRNKGLYVNTESVSGEYYNIPTLWFNGDYNTYTVTISVESAPVTNDGTTYSYCIDGIRIYNPIGDNIDDTVAGAYGDELAAYFESLRDFLLDAENLIDDSTTPDVDESTEIKGAVFIDKVENEVGVASNQIAVYEDYGPKNEVYLAEGQSIAFNVGEGVTSVQIGLKAPQASTNALVSFVDDTGKPAQGDITVGHTTDLFYTVTPDAKGNVIIKNNGEGLLSITKIKWLAIQETSFALTSTDALLLAADEFDTMPVVAYSLRASAPETEDSTDPETPVEPEQPAEPESPVEPETPTEPEEPTEPSGPNVEIENPEVPQQPDIEAVQEQIKQFVTSLFSAFRGWFGRQ